MPEGDSIYREAERLRPVLLERDLQSVRTRGGVEHTALSNKRVTAIETAGKHLTIVVDSGATIRVHLGMHGRWRHYRRGDAWERAQWNASIVLVTRDVVPVCFRARDIELRRARDPAAGLAVSQLGPDLLAPGCAIDAVVRRARSVTYRDREIGDLLLVQRVAAGIGNVYRSEVLFIVGVHPQTRVADVSDADLFALFDCARRLLVENVRRPGPRVTTGPASGLDSTLARARVWVYRRVHRPCFRCHARVESRRIGVQARTVYWCPRCQPAASC